MHQIPDYQENKLEAQHELIRKNPLATVISVGSEGIVVNHFPVILSGLKTDKGVLQGHLAR